MLEVRVQHVRYHAEHVGRIAANEVAVTTLDLVLEVADDDRREMPTHDSDCFAPIKRSNVG